MLQLQHINKEYQTGKLVQRALHDVTLNLRESEFVAVLGPSGSGKTTLLNIIGGLDRYDSGDLIINGVSTSQYSDRDWDAYRNHRVGFVFQNYNLISHQTLLANVELSLTISGIGRKERRERALDALDRVGLADQAQKRPAQISGGQMQRVAIARALVNDPDILLADEPTGALDSETSVQVMDLLKEVAVDRLVVLVTHNAELADEYATRIIQLHDGEVIADSDPFEPEEEAEEQAVSFAAPQRASMSPITSMALSLNNLWTKKTRTILTAIAGSIGIIGIALILAISAGVNRYIDVLEADMVNQYPIEIENSYYDISAFVSARGGDLLSAFTGGEDVEVYDENTVDITALIYNIFSGQSANDLVSLRDFIENDGGGINDYVTSVEYTYGVTPQIYQDNPDEVIQVHPDHFFDILGFGSTTSSNSIMSSLVSTDAFFQMPESEDLYKDHYTVTAGRWPESWNEMVLVMHEGPSTTDIGLYMLGLRDMSEMEGMIDEFVAGEEVQQPEIDETYTYDDFLGDQFKLVKNTDLYEYDSEYGVWTDKSGDEAYMQQLVDNGEPLTIVGIVELNEDEDSGILSSGFNYLPSLITHLADETAESEIVQEQLANPEINVFTGEPFGTEEDAEGFDLEALFSIDEDMFADLFDFDEEDFGDLLGEDALDALLEEADLGSVDLSDYVDLGDIDISLPDMNLSLSELMSSVQIRVSEADLLELAEELFAGYESYTRGNPRADITALGSAFTDYLNSEEAREILMQNVSEIIRAGGGIEISTDNIRSLYQDIEEDFRAWAAEQGGVSLLNLEDMINEYIGTDRARNILDQWTEENLVVDLSDVDITEEQMTTLASQLAAGYESYAAANGTVPDPDSIEKAFNDYLNSSAAQRVFSESLQSMVNMDGLEEQIAGAIESYAASIGGELGDQISAQASDAATQIAGQIEEEITDSLTGSMEGISDSLAEALKIDPTSMLDAVVLDMDAENLLELLSSLYSTTADSYEGNLDALGYTDFTTPRDIKIYPKDFESKGIVTGILDQYNADMEAAGESDKTVTYTDSMGSIMDLIAEIVQILSYVLIAFVAISLVVSCIMIGVITYISVLERKKEIGILRAIGASKRNISAVFNAETFVIGLAAGILGIVVTLLLTIPINHILHNFLGIADLSAYLPLWYALVLILLSVVLTLLSGMIPSTRASRSDPVEALRSE